ncbi:MAG: ATP-binding protein [Ignavibacteria bacterium]|jgi:CRP-like cAMP-binding protein/putative methionine-R-sulfoxide reductase with GAF domain
MESQFEFVLKSSRLLKNIDTSKFNFEQIKGSLLTINEGEIVYREGNPADSVYIIVSGEINLLKKKVLSSTKSFVFYDEDVFGYEEIFEGTSRTSTAVALRDTYLIRLSKYEFELLLHQDKRILDELKTSVKIEPEFEHEEKIFEETKEINNRERTDETVFLDDKELPEEINNLENVDETMSLPEDEQTATEEEINQQESLEKVTLNESQTEPIEEVDDETDALLKELQNIKDDEEYPTEIDLTNISEEEIKEFQKEEEPFDDQSIIEKAFESEIEELPEVSPEISKEDEEFLNRLNSSDDLNFYDNKEDDTETEIKPVSLNDDSEFEPITIDDRNTTEEESDDQSIVFRDYPELEIAEDDTAIPFEEDTDFDNQPSESSDEDQESLIVEDESIDTLEKEKEQLENFLTEAKNVPDFKSIINGSEEREEENIESNASKDNDEKEIKDEADSVMTAELLETINKAAQLVNSNIKLDDALVNIVDVACDLTDADRGTLYLVDTENEQLWSKVAIGNDIKEIRLNIGEGIAGWVAKSGETVNIKNVQEDARFKSDYDKSSGYLTKTMLCFPIKNKKEEIVGVLQLLNSNKGEFTSLDELILKGLSIHAALALENASLVEKLLQTERVTSLGKMANFLIQDIKKPILVSKRYAEHLKAKDESGQYSQVIDMLLEQLTHVADMVQTTSSYSEGKSVLHAASMNFNDLLEDLIVRIDSLVKLKNCSIEKNLDTDVNVKIDLKEFSQCFNHIVRNACDAMPDGGVITIASKRDENQVILLIKDNGLGIPDSLKEKIFEPFMSHGKKEGTGLGLSITKKIIEDHGGTIRVESELGEGADFIITFPVASLY